MEAIHGEEFKQALIGSLGPEEQLTAFRAAWMHGRVYLKTLRQAAIGCREICKGSDAELELEALCTAFEDVDNWFAVYAKELLDLEKMAGLQPRTLN